MKSFRDKYPELFTEEFWVAYAEEMRKLMIENDPVYEEFVERFIWDNIRENLPESKETTPLKSAAECRAELEAARARIAELEEYIAGLECIDRRGALGGRDE